MAAARAATWSLEEFAADAHEFAFGALADAQKAPVAGDDLVATALGAQLFVLAAKLRLQCSGLPVCLGEVSLMELAEGMANFLHDKEATPMSLSGKEINSDLP